MKKINVILISISAVLGIALVVLIVFAVNRRNMNSGTQSITQNRNNGGALQEDGSVAVGDIETIVVPAINGGQGEPAPTAPPLNVTLAPVVFKLESGSIRPAKLQVAPDQRVLIENLETEPVTVVIPPLPQNNNSSEVIIPPRETYMLVLNRQGRYDIQIKGNENARSQLEVFSADLIQRQNEKRDN